jgi:hypothetical protein
VRAGAIGLEQRLGHRLVLLLREGLPAGVEPALRFFLEAVETAAARWAFVAHETFLQFAEVR